MNKKIHQKLPMIPYLECELVPITDPVEQAAVDRLFDGAKLSKADKILLANLPSAKKPKPRKRK